MTKRRKMHGDPRRLGGSIAGPGGPRDRNAMVIDSTNAVLLEAVTVCTVDTFREGDPAGEVFALQMSGRINRTPDRTEVLYLLNEDAAAALITELMACASRAGRREDVMGLVAARMASLHAKDAVRPVEE